MEVSSARTVGRNLIPAHVTSLLPPSAPAIARLGPPWPALARLGPPSPVLARPTGRVLGRRPSIARHPRGIVRSRPYISLIIIIIIIILYMYLILQLIFHFSGMKNKKISWDELYI